jgi:hypothetical protein
MGGLFISVRFVHHGAYFSAWPQGALDGRLTKLVTDGGGLRAARQARLVEARARRLTGCGGQHTRNTSPAPGGVQHANNTDETAFSGTRWHAC